MQTCPIFSLVLSDDTIYQGGLTYFDTKWKEIPLDKKIKRLFYALPDGNHLCLSKFDKYYHFVEATTDINGRKTGQINLEYAYILGKKDDKITCYKISLKHRKDKFLGTIERNEFSKDSEFVKGLCPTGWR